MNDIKRHGILRDSKQWTTDNPTHFWSELFNYFFHALKKKRIRILELSHPEGYSGFQAFAYWLRKMQYLCGGMTINWTVSEKSLSNWHSLTFWGNSLSILIEQGAKFPAIYLHVDSRPSDEYAQSPVLGHICISISLIAIYSHWQYTTIPVCISYCYCLTLHIICHY